MATKPTAYPEWDTTQINAIVPDATHKAEGWLNPAGVPEKPPFQTFNYWMNEVYRWILYLDQAAASRGYIDGCIINNAAADLTNDIEIGDGEATFTDGTYFITFPVLNAPTKQIDVAWTEGNNAGGRSGPLVANTHYYFFLIAKNDGTIDAGFDTSATAANLMAASAASGYVWWRQIMSIFTNSTSGIINFSQYPNGYVYFKSEITDVNDSAGTISSVYTATITVPPNHIGFFNIYGEASAATTVSIVLKRKNGTVSQATCSTGDDPLDPQYKFITGQVIFQVDSNMQMDYTIGGNGVWVRANIITVGFISNRGKDL